MPARSLTGRVALITGAGRGLGREAARWCSQEGAGVVICARTADGITSLADELRDAGGEVLAEMCDVADSAAVARLVANAAERFGRLDIAVANAAVLGPVGEIQDVASCEWAETVRINVTGTAALIRAVIPVMAARGFGRIVTMSGAGIGGPHPADHVSAYVASKGAVVALTEAVAAELPAGLTINALAPGAVPTGFMAGVIEAGPERAGTTLFEAVRATTMPDLSPLRDLLLYVVGDDADWLSGRCLSARWDAPVQLRALASQGLSEARFRLRRIDEALYGVRGENNA